MTTAFHIALQPFLAEFAAAHRGVRAGRLFGRPALYSGRRLVISIVQDGLIVRLPDAIARRELRGSARPYGRRQATASWVLYTPRSVEEARRLVPVLELALEHAAHWQPPA